MAASATPRPKLASQQSAQLSSESDRSTNDRFQENQNPYGLAGIGAVADWQLAASDVVSGNGKKWGGNRLAACSVRRRDRERQELGGMLTGDYRG